MGRPSLFWTIYTTFKTEIVIIVTLGIGHVGVPLKFASSRALDMG